MAAKLPRSIYRSLRALGVDDPRTIAVVLRAYKLGLRHGKPGHRSAKAKAPPPVPAEEFF